MTEMPENKLLFHFFRTLGIDVVPPQFRVKIFIPNGERLMQNDKRFIQVGSHIPMLAFRFKEMTGIYALTNTAVIIASLLLFLLSPLANYTKDKVGMPQSGTRHMQKRIPNTLDELKLSLGSDWFLETELPTLPGEQSGETETILYDGKKIGNAISVKYVWAISPKIKSRAFKGEKEKKRRLPYILSDPERKEMILVLDKKNKHSVYVSETAVEEVSSGKETYAVTISVPADADTRVFLVERAVRAIEKNKKSHIWYTGVIAPIVFIKKHK